MMAPALGPPDLYLYTFQLRNTFLMFFDLQYLHSSTCPLVLKIEQQARHSQDHLFIAPPGG